VPTVTTVGDWAMSQAAYEQEGKVLGPEGHRFLAYGSHNSIAIAANSRALLNLGMPQPLCYKTEAQVERERKVMKRILITRDSSGNVEFETVTVDNTETVFFLNEDSQSEHWPDISDNPVGAAPSDPSSQCFPEPTYGCRIHGHENEQGTINMPPA
jgi:hypothetical protein